MKALFMCNSAHPMRDEFFALVEQSYPVARYDSARPAEAQFAGIDVVIDMGGATTTEQLIDAGVAAGVKLWQVATTGLDHVNVKYFLKKGMRLAHSPGQSSAAPLAEHALYLMLCFAKGLRRNDPRAWRRSLSDDLEGKTLGLIGFGASARKLAQRASALGLRLMAIDVVDVPTAVQKEFQLDFFGGSSDRDRLLSEADYVSLHVPLTSATKHLIDRRALGLMKPTAVLINVARGELVDEVALAEALSSGRIRGAGVDVFSHEPVDPANPLLSLDNLIATPHIAGFTAGTWRRRAAAAIENIDRLSRGLDPLYQVVSVC